MRSSRVRRVKRTARKSISRALSRMPRSKRSKRSNSKRRNKGKRTKRGSKRNIFNLKLDELRETLSLAGVEDKQSVLLSSPKKKSKKKKKSKAWSSKLHGKGTKGKKGKKSHKKKYKKKKMKGGAQESTISQERANEIVDKIISKVKDHLSTEDMDEVKQKREGLIESVKFHHKTLSNPLYEFRDEEQRVASIVSNQVDDIKYYFSFTPEERIRKMKELDDDEEDDDDAAAVQKGGGDSKINDPSAAAYALMFGDEGDKQKLKEYMINKQRAIDSKKKRDRQNLKKKRKTGWDLELERIANPNTREGVAPPKKEKGETRTLVELEQIANLPHSGTSSIADWRRQLLYPQGGEGLPLSDDV